MAANFQYIMAGLLIFLLFWLLFLTLYFGKKLHYLNKLAKIDKDEDLGKILEGLLKKIGDQRQDIDKIKEKNAELEDRSRIYIQKTGLVRFNPFGDTGGDQSFVLALLNKENDGIVLSVLNGRTGTRIYSKPVKKGMGAEYELSNEEKEAIKKAESEL